MAHCCCVCLETDVILQDIVSKVGDSPTWMDKLRDVIPEMNWFEDFQICNSCTIRVEQAFTFRSSLLPVRDRTGTNKTKSEMRKEEHNCVHCQKSFSDIDELDYHEKMNHAIIDEEPVLVIDEEEEPISNEKLKENKKPISCSKCPELFYTATSLYRHNAARHKTHTYKCHLCEKAFLHPGLLKSHINVHQNLRKFKCYHCDNGYNTKKALKGHLKRQGLLAEKNKQYNCDICKDKFLTAAEVITHCVKKHSMEASDIKPYKCNLCSVACCTYYKLCYHKTQAHKN